MSWGTFWLFYHCPVCGKQFKSDGQSLHLTSCGICPQCQTPGEFIGESGETAPKNPNDYEETD